MTDSPRSGIDPGPEKTSVPEPETPSAARNGDDETGLYDPDAERRLAHRLARHPWRLALPLIPLALGAAVFALAGFLAGRDAAFERGHAAQHEVVAALTVAALSSETLKSTGAALDSARTARTLIPVESRLDPWFAGSAFERGVEGLAQSWTEAHEALQRLAERAPAAAALREHVERFRPVPARMLVSADALLDLLAEREEAGAHLAAVGRLMTITQRSALGAARALDPGPELLAAVDRFGRDVVFLGELINAMQNGSTALGIARVDGTQARALVAELGREFRGSAPLVQGIIEQASALATHEAARTELRDALGTVHSHLGALAGAYRERAASRPPLTPVAGLLLALAALALFGVLRSLRRDAAEGRRLVARHAGYASRAHARGEELEARRAHGAASARHIQLIATAVAGVEEALGAVGKALDAHCEALERAALVAADGVGRARDLRTQGYEVVQAADAAAGGARAARDAVAETDAALDALASCLRESVARMRHVAESSALVAEAAGEIRRTGELARMLSINVAVRASSGGGPEQALGGFSDDVQQLADRALRSSRGIRSLGHAMRETAEEARGALERAARDAARARGDGRPGGGPITGDAGSAARGNEDGSGTAPSDAPLPGGNAAQAGGKGMTAPSEELAGTVQRLRGPALSLLAALEVQLKYATLLHREVRGAGQALGKARDALHANAARTKQAKSAAAAAVGHAESFEAPRAASPAGSVAPALPAAGATKGGRPAGRT